MHLGTCDKPNLRVWGYRNVWFRFHPSEANVFVPVSLNMFSVMHDAFMNTFVTQKDASFPSHEHDGPFSQLAQQIQVEQYQMLKTCLGREWFYEHPSALIRAPAAWSSCATCRPRNSSAPAASCASPSKTADNGSSQPRRPVVRHSCAGGNPGRFPCEPRTCFLPFSSSLTTIALVEW